MYDDDDDAVDQSQECADDPSCAPEEGADDSADDGTYRNPGEDSSDDTGQGLPSAHQVDAGRNALGSLLGTLQDNGVDIDALAQQAGVDTTDVDDMEQGDLVALAKHVATTHPELAQDTLGRFPVAQGLLGRFL